MRKYFFLIFFLLSLNIFAQETGTIRDQFKIDDENYKFNEDGSISMIIKKENTEYGIKGFAVYESNFHYQYIMLNYSISGLPNENSFFEAWYYWQEKGKNELLKNMDYYFRDIIKNLVDHEWTYYTMKELDEKKVKIYTTEKTGPCFGSISIKSFYPVDLARPTLVNNSLEMDFGFYKDGKYRKTIFLTNLYKTNMFVAVPYALKNEGIWLSKEDVGIIPIQRNPIVILKELTVEEYYLEIRKFDWKGSLEEVDQKK